jgi:bacteriocin biosynthesis cyclodehydratase domain-containing protein
MGDMDNVPRIKRYYSLIAHSPDIVELRAGVWNVVSHTVSDDAQTGTLFSILKQLDGTHTPKQIAHDLAVPRHHVEALIDHLDGLGLIEESSSSALDYYLDTVTPWRVDNNDSKPRQVTIIGDNALATMVGSQLGERVDIVADITGDDGMPAWRSLKDRDREWLFDGLAFQERLLSFRHWEEQLLVYISDIADPPLAQTINRICLGLGIPWLHAIMDGPFILIGPTFVPRRTACYECLELRIGINLRENASYQRYKDALVKAHVLGSTPFIEPSLAGILASHTALEVMNYVLTGYSFTAGKVMSMYLPTMEFTCNEVLRAPNCPACGSSSERDATELYFAMEALATQRIDTA